MRLRYQMSGEDVAEFVMAEVLSAKFKVEIQEWQAVDVVLQRQGFFVCLRHGSQPQHQLLSLVPT
jgi:hypothetical protein